MAAPIFLVAFIYPFVPLFVQEGANRGWTLGVHFIVSLCFFDGMFTVRRRFVLIAAHGFCKFH